MPVRVLISLILCNLIWSVNPVAGKIVLAEAPPSLAAWLRYGSALASYVVAILLLRFVPAFREKIGRPFLSAKRRKDWIWVGVIGIAGFGFAPLIQMIGLHASRATDNALIVAMEPLITVFMAFLFLRETISALHFACFTLSLGGFVLLAGISPAGLLASNMDGHLFGNLLMFASLMGEGFYSVAGRKLLSEKHSPVGIFGTGLAIGVIFLTVLILAMIGGSAFAPMTQMSWKAWLGVLWLGPLGTTLTYFYWMLALVEVPVASIAVTLFVQPVAGALWGYWFLNERLTLLQSFGAMLILSALVLMTGVEQRKSRNLEMAQ